MDRLCYTYLVINNITGRVYYGARYARGCHPDDLWRSYFTSSKVVKSSIQKYGKESFSFQVRKTFGSDYERCLKWESKVLRRMKVSKREDFYNIEESGVPLPLYGEKNPTYGKARPDASIRMKENNPMKNPEIAKVVADKKRGVSSPTKGRPNPAQQKRFTENNPMKNQESLSKMRQTMFDKYNGGNPAIGTTWFANVITKQRKRVPKNELDMYKEEDGWIRLSNKTPIPDSI